MYLSKENRHTIFGKKVGNMEKAKRGVRICLLCVVVLAIVMGILYYYHELRNTEIQAEGTLIAVTGNQWSDLWQ